MPINDRQDRNEVCIPKVETPEQRRWILVCYVSQLGSFPVVSSSHFSIFDHSPKKKERRNVLVHWKHVSHVFSSWTISRNFSFQDSNTWIDTARKLLILSVYTHSHMQSKTGHWEGLGVKVPDSMHVISTLLGDGAFSLYNTITTLFTMGYPEEQQHWREKADLRSTQDSSLNSGQML